MNIIQIFLISCLYAIGSTRWFVALNGTWAYMPMCLGYLVGLILGDPVKGTLIGATIHTIYLGVTFYGGAMPADTRMATIVTTAFAVTAGLETEACMALAVPFAALGVALDPVWRTINTSLWGPYVDKAIEEVNLKKIKFGTALGPFITGFLCSAPVVFIVLYLGQGVVATTIANLPDWLNASLKLMGGILPALGFATYIRIIGTKKTIPFFILGFYLVTFFDLSIFGCAILAFSVAYLTLYVDKNVMPD